MLDQTTSLCPCPSLALSETLSDLCFCPSDMELHITNAHGLGHRVVGLDAGHELHLRLQRIIVQFLGAHALRNRQLQLIQ